jgi:hypothetical protein
MKKSHMAALLLAAGLAVHAAHAAPATAVDITAGTEAETTGDSTRGYRFTVAAGNTFSVTALGVLNYATSELLQAHDVGLWDRTGTTLLASVTVPAGPSGDVVVDSAFGTLADWRFINLGNALTLTAGDYLIGAYYANLQDTVPSSQDSYLYTTNAANIQSLSGITVTGGAFIGATGLAAPTGPSSNYYFGPSFLAERQQVPEPASLALVGLALAGVAATRRRKSAA